MPTKTELIGILTIVLQGDPKWVGAKDDVVLSQVNWSYIGETERANLQKAGKDHGCHVCGLKVENNAAAQTWIADHQPPVGFTSGATDHYEDDTPLSALSKTVRLFPHCKACSLKQSGLIRDICAAGQGGKWPTLSADQRTLIEAHPQSHLGVNNFIETTAKSTKATATESALIQTIGATFGCHSCGTKIPVTDYEADHVPPATLFQYTWASTLITDLGLAPKQMKIRPACGSCQRAQGGHVTHALRQCAKYIYDNSLPILITTAGFAKHQV